MTKDSPGRMFYPEINVARGIGIALVVLGHAFPDASLPNGVQLPFWRYIFGFVYSFHMPLFFFLAGFVTNKYYASIEEKIVHIKRRASRLIVPYFVWGLIYIPFRLLLSRISSSSFEIKEVWRAFLGDNPYSGLWFLYALFFIDIIRTLLIDSEKKQWLYFGGSLLCIIVTRFITIDEPINWILAYSFYYALGILCRENYTKIKKLKSIHVNLNAIILLVLLVLINWMIPRDSGVVYRCVSVFTSLVGCACVLCWSLMLEKSKALGTIGSYSMDIYILSGPMLVVLRTILFYKLGMDYSVYVVLSTIICVFLPIVISKYIIRKNNLLATLLVGY